MKNKISLDLNIERMASFIEWHIKEQPVFNDGVPSFASLEFSINGACNRRCIFCPRVDEALYPNIYNSMDFELYQKVINELASVNYKGRISYSGFSEPLLTKNLEDYIVYAKEKCPHMTVEMVSNGDALSLKRLEQVFAAGLDNIRLSLYDGPEQVDKFTKMRIDAGLNENQVILRKRYLSAEENYGLTISNRAGAVNIESENIQIKALDEPLKQACYYPFYKMMVDYDGTVMICSNDWHKKFIVGQLKNQTVFEAWNSEKFNFARKNLAICNRKFSPCLKCDVNGLYNGKTHFEAWNNYNQKV